MIISFMSRGGGWSWRLLGNDFCTYNLCCVEQNANNSSFFFSTLKLMNVVVVCMTHCSNVCFCVCLSMFNMCCRVSVGVCVCSSLVGHKELMAAWVMSFCRLWLCAGLNYNGRKQSGVLLSCSITLTLSVKEAQQCLPTVPSVPAAPV